MKRVLKALLISATATTAAAVVLSVLNKKNETNPEPLKPKSGDQFQDLDAEQTEALVAELAAQV